MATVEDPASIMTEALLGEHVGDPISFGEFLECFSKRTLFVSFDLDICSTAVLLVMSIRVI